MRRLLAVLSVCAVCLTLFGCKSQVDPAVTTAPIQETQVQEQKLVILYTADVHNALKRHEYSGTKGPMGYGALAAYAQKLEAEGKTVLLIDGGDSMTDRELMKDLGYWMEVPGGEELALGIDQLLDRDYVCCNVLNVQTGEPVFKPYKMAACADWQIAFVGITSPKTELTQEQYGFPADEQAFYDCVQNAIDQAQQEGADLVIAVGHLGAEPADSPYTSADVIANTTGLTAFLDGRSHRVLEGSSLADADGKQVPILAVGAELTNIGSLELNLNDGSVTASLISGLTEDDEQILAAVEELMQEQETTEAIQ